MRGPAPQSSVFEAKRQRALALEQSTARKAASSPRSTLRCGVNSMRPFRTHQHEANARTMLSGNAEASCHQLRRGDPHVALADICGSQPQRRQLRAATAAAVRRGSAGKSGGAHRAARGDTLAAPSRAEHAFEGSKGA